MAATESVMRRGEEDTVPRGVRRDNRPGGTRVDSRGHKGRGRAAGRGRKKSSLLRLVRSQNASSASLTRVEDVGSARLGVIVFSQISS